MFIKRKRSRLFLITILFSVFLTACQTSFFKKAPSVKQDSSVHLEADIISTTDSDILNITVHNGTAYLVSESNIVKYNLASNERSLIVEAIGNTAICADKDNIFTYNKEQNSVLKYSFNGDVICSYPLSFNAIDVDQMKVKNNTILIVSNFVNDGGYSESELYRLDMSSGKSNKITNFKGNDSYSLIKSLDFEDEKTIMISSLATTSVMHTVIKAYRIDIKKETVLEEYILPNFNDCSYDPINKCFYYTYHTENGLGINSYSPETATTLTLSKIENNTLDSSIIKQLFYANDNVILWNEASSQFIIVDLSQDYDPLKILLSDNVKGSINLTPIIEQFESTSNRAVLTIEYPDNIYTEKLRTKLLASDTDFDIYLINNPSQDNLLASIHKYELYEPLDNYDGIANNFSQMYDGLRSMMSHNNKLFGVPYDISIFSLMDLKCDFSQYGYTIPDKHWTNSDLWKLCDEVLNSNEYNMSVFKDPYGMLLLVEIFIQESINQNSLDKSLLLELLSNIKKYNDAGVLFDHTGSNKHLTDYSPGFFYKFIAHDNLPDYSAYGTIIYPSFSGKNYHELKGCAFINKLSTNKESAAIFLEIMTNSENIYNNDIYRFSLFGPDLTKYKIYNNWSPIEISYLSDLTDLYENSGVYTFDNYSLMDYIRENVMNGFFDGSIPVDEATKMIYDRVNYTYFE